MGVGFGLHLPYIFLSIALLFCFLGLPGLLGILFGLGAF